MKQIYYVIISAIFIIVDQWSKYLFTKTPLNYTSNLIEIIPFKNFTVIGGMGKNELFFRWYVFLISTYILAIIFFLACEIKKKFTVFKIHIFILFAGIFGNYFDKLLYGHARDFISLKLILISKYIFNLADVFIVYAFLVAICCFFKQGKEILPIHDLRGKWFINSKLQLKLAWRYGLVALFGSLLSLSLLGLYLPDSARPNLSAYLNIMTYSFSGGILLGFIISHKVAGPIYALSRFFQQNIHIYKVKEGHKLNFREDDDLKDLENLLNKNIDQ